jgi:hypothetical protein
MFIAFCYLLPNPYAGPGERYNVPIAYSIAAFDAAALYDDVEPHELVAIIIQEHGGKAPYSSDSIGDDGKAVGLMQLHYVHVSAYNKAFGVELEMRDLLDFEISIDVAAYALHRIKRVHRTKRRCRNKPHHWQAHYMCSYNARDQCNTRRRERFVRKLSKWRS